MILISRKKRSNDIQDLKFEKLHRNILLISGSVEWHTSGAGKKGIQRIDYQEEQDGYSAQNLLLSRALTSFVVIRRVLHGLPFSSLLFLFVPPILPFPPISFSCHFFLSFYLSILPCPISPRQQELHRQQLRRQELLHRQQLRRQELLPRQHLL